MKYQQSGSTATLILAGSGSMPSLDQLPEVVLSNLANYLSPEDLARLSQTCRRLHSLLPHSIIIRGADFTIHGPRGGHWAPEPYFDMPPLTSIVKCLALSVKWRDQGWGNRKGEIFLQLMRPTDSREDEMIVEKRQVFGIAEHDEVKVRTDLRGEPVVTLARPGDFYRFMRNAGGGGGHQLIVSNFRVIVTLP